MYDENVRWLGDILSSTIETNKVKVLEMNVRVRKIKGFGVIDTTDTFDTTDTVKTFKLPQNFTSSEYLAFLRRLSNFKSNVYEMSAALLVHSGEGNPKTQLMLVQPFIGESEYGVMMKDCDGCEEL